ncbi:hypothetical protein D9M70_595340 [compost metagenome]
MFNTETSLVNRGRTAIQSDTQPNGYGDIQTIHNLEVGGFHKNSERGGIAS